MTFLTDEQLIQAYAMACDCEGTQVILGGLRAVADAAVAAAREGQEPVAWGVAKRGGRVWYVNDSRSVCQGYAQHYQHRDSNGSDQSVIPLYTFPPATPVVPDGWVITRCDDGAIIIRHDGIGGVVVEQNQRFAREIPESILWELANAILNAAQETKV